MDTMTNANRVPMFTSSDSFSSEMNAESTATTTPVIAVVTHGVPKRGWTVDSCRGSRPSRDIANSTRAWPSMSTRITVVIPQMPPREISRVAQSACTALNASASGADDASVESRYLTIPVITAETAK